MNNTGDICEGWNALQTDKMKELPDGTPFLLRLKTGAIHVCELFGNMEGDASLKAIRLTDGKVISLEKVRNARFIIIQVRS